MSAEATLDEVEIKEPTIPNRPFPKGSPLHPPSDVQAAVDKARAESRRRQRMGGLRRMDSVDLDDPRASDSESDHGVVEQRSVYAADEVAAPDEDEHQLLGAGASRSAPSAPPPVHWTSTPIARLAGAAALGAVATSIAAALRWEGGGPSEQRGLTTFQVTFARYAGQLACTLLWMLVEGKFRSFVPQPTRVRGARGLIGVRAVASIGALLCVNFALARLPVADVEAIQYCAPLVAALYAVAYRRGGFSSVDGFALALCCAGVVCIWLGDTTTDEAGVSVSTPTWAVVAAVAASLMSGTSYVALTHLWRTGVEPVVVVFWVSLAGSVVSTCAIMFSPDSLRDMSPGEVFCVLVLGAVGFLAEMLLADGLQGARAGPAVLVLFLEVLVSFALQAGLLGESEAGLSFLGALITGAGVLAAVGGDRWRRRL